MGNVDQPRRGLLRGLLAGLAAATLAGCDAASRSSWFPKLLKRAEPLSHGAHRLVTAHQPLAQEFTKADLSPDFRSNGTSNPGTDIYKSLAANHFVDWSLRVDGLVARPTQLTLAELRAMRSRTQITRHDCVEGWSAIAEWTGVPLGDVLARVQPRDDAKYVVFHCADPMSGGQDFYYESIDFDDAYHPQTILAYQLNGQDLPIKNGAPLRLRVERQLGYKHAKYLMHIELVAELAGIAGGKGGYWEDHGYQWYAGI
jgi:DMSO/TMAO reductase YedYZ molybdopterin-dependent catalytic subunit